MTGAFRTYRPVTIDELETHEERLAFALGPALRWQLWLFFPPSPFGGGGMSMPCDDLPRRPPPESIEGLARMIESVARALPATELILGLERRGGPDPTRIDREWMRVVGEASDRAGVCLRSVLISHSRGVRSHEPPQPALDSVGG